MCQNCVASLFLLLFLTFCVVRDHEAMGSNPVTPTKGKTMKTSSFFIFCRKCVALPLFRRLSAALGLFKCFALAPPSLAVTPTIKNTHALFALCVFYLPVIRDLNGTLRKQHSALFLVPGVIATALAAQKKAHKTPAPVGLRSKSRHSDHKKHTRVVCVVCFLFARNKGFERCVI